MRGNDDENIKGKYKAAMVWNHLYECMIRKKNKSVTNYNISNK